MNGFDVKPYESGFLDVDSDVGGSADVRHELFYELSGNPKGIPLVRLHGGPGSCSMAKHKITFDPDKYHIITYDQRGCGKSKPIGLIERNTTQHLIADMETLREHLGVDKWVVTGGSWGSTLALLYAQVHPERVLALGIFGIFLAEKSEVDWLYNEDGFARLFPEDYQTFRALVTDAQAENPLPFMYDLLTTKPYADIKAIVDAFGAREMNICGMEANILKAREALRAKRAMLPVSEQRALAEAEALEDYYGVKVLVHYMVHHLFIDEGQILRDMHKIAHIPLYIAQGRYDVVCPFVSAYKLHKAHAGSHLVTVSTSGHNLSEMLAELIHIFNEDIYQQVTK